MNNQAYVYVRRDDRFRYLVQTARVEAGQAVVIILVNTRVNQTVKTLDSD